VEGKSKRVRVDHREGIGIVMPEGHLTLGDGDRDLLDLVGRILASGRLRVVLDLAGVDYLDAAGLGMLIRCQRRVAGRGGRFILTGARSKVREILDLAEVAAYLEQAEGLEQAVEMLSSRAPAGVPAKPVAHSRVA
jgi:anti-sigma B factor antagonist